MKGLSLDANSQEVQSSSNESTHERKLETCAIKIQFAFRTYKALQSAVQDRNDSPALDDHGHHNPSTILMFNKTPLIHIHHHGISLLPI